MTTPGTRSRSTRPPTKILLATSVAIATAISTGVVSSAASAAPAAPSNHTAIYRSPLTKAQIAQYSQNQNQRVIVLLRNQLAESLSGSTAGLRAHSSAVSRSQTSIRTELQQLHAPQLHSFSILNALSASVSSLEAKRLAADPAVLAVVPDAKVTLPASSTDTATSAGAKAATPVNTTPGICGTKKSPLVEPEALSQMNALYTHYGITGKGVRIAVFPDGIDPNIPDYIRPDGSHAIFDYKDFTGDGPQGVTSGAEAFGDASSIIAQGNQTYDLSKVVNPNLPLPANCDIKIKGVAPGASVAVMKVFGLGSSFDSLILQAEEYAVSHDHVNILSQSFGGNPEPNTGIDPISTFNALAVKQGITVVASSGDAGITNTIGTPATADSGVISTGATSSFRLHAQLSEHGYQLGGYKGWESNNIATLSSSGFTAYGPNSVDVVAPGDSGWANCSTNTDVFVDCANAYGATGDAPPVLAFGGTSEACPLTAATAALVIEAYRSTHKGASPTPAVVKRIIMSSAKDLSMPAQEQGAGQVNALRAVQLARSFQTKAPTGVTSLFAPAKLETVGAPGSKTTKTVIVRNTAATTRSIAPTLQSFSTPTTIAGTTFTYDPTSPATPTFTYWLDGKPEQYAEQDFTVPSGYQRLNVRFGFPATDAHSAQTVFEVLIDPSGKLAQDSDPQGTPLGFGQGDVANPKAGTWRAIFFSRPGSNKYNGPITYQATVQKRTVTAGAVKPASLALKPNQLGSFRVTYRTPATPGDRDQEITFGAQSGVLPVLTRSYALPTASTPATFTGELTTGNGRAVFPSQELPYQFGVPAGTKDIDIDVHIADPGYEVVGQLIAPGRAPVVSSSNTFVDLTKATPTATDSQNLHLTWRAPIKGRWTVVLAAYSGTSSGKVATTVTGTIALNTVQVSTTGVPTSSQTVLTAGQPAQASVTVTNTGSTPETYYIDPRRSGQSSYVLGFATDPNGTLPTSTVSQAIVPPATTSLTMVANASKPIDFAMSPYFGTPEIESTNGTTAVATTTGRYLPASEWGCAPTLVGPFATPTPSVSYSCAAFATTDTIDDAVTATGGNIWDTATDPNSPNVFTPTSAVVVQPGASTTIPVTITPSADDAGGTVTGYLAVQSFNADTFSSDVLAHLPYTYSVQAPPAS